MTQTTHGDPAHIRADNLRAKSDALLKRCGYKIAETGENVGWWAKPGLQFQPGPRPHPYANAQDAVDLAEAMGMEVTDISLDRSKGIYAAVVGLPGKRFLGRCTTIAEAISAAIREAVE